MLKKLLLPLCLAGAPTLLMAQNGGPHKPGTTPGEAGWMGQTLQIGAPRPDADVGGLNPADIIKPLSDEWRAYSGDLSGKRYSALKLVNTTTAKNLSLKWRSRRRRIWRTRRRRGVQHPRTRHRRWWPRHRGSEQLRSARSRRRRPRRRRRDLRVVA
jgi:hypothetical protein